MIKPTYEELETAVMNLEAALSTATESLANAHHVLRVETARSKELEAQVQGLAAENADLKHPGTYLPSKRETPATDAVMAEIRNEARAEGINFAAGRLAAAFNNGFIDKPLPEVFDVTRMILTAKEDIANEPAADGLSGGYAETALKEWEQQLRKEASDEQ